MKTFGRPVVIVSDNDQILRTAESRGIPVWRHIGGSSDFALQRASAERDHFRGGFWLESSRRFMALQAFQNVLGEPILHVESDVVIFPSLDLSSFAALPEGLAFALVNATHGVGTLIYSRHASEMTRLTETLARVRTDDPTVTDMQLLGRLAQHDARRPAILPTSSRVVSILKSGLDDKLRRLLSEGDHLFEGIFDAATVGQYLLGLDSRNHKGRRLLYSVPGDHVVDPRLAKFKLEGAQLVMANAAGDEALVHCLHVHSKDIRAFSDISRRKLLHRRIAKVNRGETVEWDTWGFVRAFRDSAEYRFRLARQIQKRPTSVPNGEEGPWP
jgi:hypothetical protein